MAIALVANVSRATGGTTAGIDTTGATVIVLSCGYIATGASNDPRPNVSDSNSNAWIYFDPLVNGNGAVAIFVAINPVVGSGHTFTCTGGLPSFEVAAFSGTHASFPLGPSSNGTGST